MQEMERGGRRFKGGNREREGRRQSRPREGSREGKDGGTAKRCKSESRLRCVSHEN